MKNRHHCHPAFLVTLLGCAVLPASAATKMWDGGAVLNDNWSSNLNWDPNGAPVAGDIILFPNVVLAGDTITNNDLPANTLFASLRITGGYSILGNRFRISNGITATPNGATDVAFIGAEVTLTANQSIRAESGVPLRFGPTCILNAGTFDIRLDADAAASVIQVEGDLEGSGRLTIDGPGEVAFVSGKTYTGPLQVNANGRLRITTGNGLGATSGGVTLNGSLILDSSVNLTLNEPLVLTAGTIETVDQAGAGVFILAQPVTVTGGTFFPKNTRRIRANGVLSGNGPMTKQGTGVLELAGAATNTVGGTFTLRRGLVELNKSGTALALGGPVVIAPEAAGATGELRFVRSNQLASTATVTVGDGGVLNLNGQDQELAELALRSGARVETGAGTLTVSTRLSHVVEGQAATEFTGKLAIGPEAVEFDIEENLTMAAAVSGVVAAASLRKTGEARVAFNGPVALSRIDIAEGIVEVNSSNGALPVRLEGATAELTGKGAVGVITAGAGGAVRPADEGLTARGLSLNAASTLKIRLFNAIGGPVGARLNCGEAVNLGGASLRLEGLGGFTASPGDRLVILSKQGAPAESSVVGAFNGLPDGQAFTVFGHSFSIDYQGGDGNDVELTVLPPGSVPLEITEVTITPGSGGLAGQNIISVAGRGDGGTTHLIETTTDFLLWTPAGETVADPSSGAFAFALTRPASLSTLFFRVRKP